ncbi:MAG: hypothetical protein COW18_11955 [Zetaproteobacteria bacterium CG12_big_fil_rev_8_21_14_0_65_54_13]|nr:MAG: hypothetical protein COX55_07610 [Zetaproteobacteria bacterium CG23_combo_of_CG06-09_8_20_14_all_54_7]PIW45155.1 MAG: hypothetical protein COW18_11955 [Zetaproteobacteria bacterium CG12_big_fil_rev_8_21_14_0_65_54_13]PIX55605.1 MAG: hypothetical protein COZ50_01725 [Zetaproteobacteria bacterium CG_4_10_14_3_um_filter_54_28]PJA27731.1 MAG: hypothetical protein CO188_11375 [Zetaproteobacteria bacterium CG_4_9_14_3_um_filter_54_145]
MPDAFIWYHADDTQEPALLKWLDEVEASAGVRGKLYLRKQDDKTTFMEAYTEVSAATIRRIERLAKKQPVFEHIARRCESFIEITC